MPKKFAGENSKAAAAKARKNEKDTSEKARKDSAAEDAKWADDDKGLAKKLAKKEEAEKKRLEAAAKKKERQDMEKEEEATIISRLQKTNPKKVTQAQIRDDDAKREAAARGKSAEVETHLSKPLEENINRLEVDGDEARTLDEAISVLSIKDGPAVDKHPEKRMKAAYEEFEKERLPQLKAENNNMRLSQLKQMLRKEWQKHPNNPLNVKLAAIAAEQKL